jgi:hypothetical protein
MFTDLSVTVYYDPNTTTKSSGDLEAIIRTAIADYSETNLNQFGITLRQSRLVNFIDNLDVSVSSSDLSTKAIIEYSPPLATISNPSFNFGNALNQPYPFDETIGFTNYTPAITSSQFSIDGVLVTMQDDGQGNILAITASSATRRVFKRNLGTVNYTTGVVKLSNFIVSSYVGDSIRILANTKNKDIKAPKERILIVRPSDISVSVLSV